MGAKLRLIGGAGGAKPPQHKLDCKAPPRVVDLRPLLTSRKKSVVSCGGVWPRVCVARRGVVELGGGARALAPLLLVQEKREARFIGGPRGDQQAASWCGCSSSSSVSSATISTPSTFASLDSVVTVGLRCSSALISPGPEIPARRASSDCDKPAFCRASCSFCGSSLSIFVLPVDLSTGRFN